jgi:hypothetical protein
MPAADVHVIPTSWSSASQAVPTATYRSGPPTTAAIEDSEKASRYGTRSQRSSAESVGSGVEIGSTVATGDGDGLGVVTGDGEGRADWLAIPVVGDAEGEGVFPAVQPLRSVRDARLTTSLAAAACGRVTVRLRDASLRVVVSRCRG